MWTCLKYDFKSASHSKFVTEDDPRQTRFSQWQNKGVKIANAQMYFFMKLILLFVFIMGVDQIA